MPKAQEKDTIKMTKYYDNIEFSGTDFHDKLDERRKSQLDESSRFLNDALELAYQQQLER